MADIHANGRMSAKITVGAINSGIDKDLVEELLSTKADINHTHDYNELSNLPEIPSIEGLASEEYVNTKISEIPKVDLSDYVTNEELMKGLENKAEREHVHEQYLTEHQDVSNLALKSEIPSIEGLASEEYVNSQISDIKGNVSSTFNTLEKIEMQIKNISNNSGGNSGSGENTGSNGGTASDAQIESLLQDIATLYQEIETIYGSGGRDKTYNDIAKINSRLSSTYTKANSAQIIASSLQGQLDLINTRLKSVEDYIWPASETDEGGDANE